MNKLVANWSAKPEGHLSSTHRLQLFGRFRQLCWEIAYFFISLLLKLFTIFDLTFAEIVQF